MLGTVSVLFAEGRAYFLLYALLALGVIIELFFEDERVSRWLGRLGALSIILFIGLRWNTGTDWLAYFKVFYTNDTNADYDSLVFGLDIGYLVLNRIVYFFTTNYTIFLLVDALIAVGLVYIFIERSTRFPVMGIYLFYNAYAITHFMGSNRRMLAIGLVCLAYTSMIGSERVRDRWREWVVPFALAATTHRTSLAAMAGLVTGRRAWRTDIVLVLLAVALAAGVGELAINGLAALGNMLSDYTGITAVQKLVFYTSSEFQLDVEIDPVKQAMLGVAKRSSLLVVFISYMHFGKPDVYMQRLYNIYIIGCLIYFALLTSPIFQIISTYFTIVEIALLPMILHRLPGLKILYVLYVLVMPLFLLVAALAPYSYLYLPYVWVLP